MDLNKFYRSFVEFKESLRIRKHINEINAVLEERSMYPDMERKSYKQRKAENIKWLLKYGEVCKYYNSYGFDVKGLRDQNDYISYRKFRTERNNENYFSAPFAPYLNKTCILRDKILFASYFGKMLGQKYVINDLGMLQEDGNIRCFSDQNIVSFEDFFQQQKKPYFVKKLFGECGDGCYLLKPGDYDVADLKKKVLGSSYIIQEQLAQHEDLNKINPSCVNTIRIITIMGQKSKTPHVFEHYLRVGINSINDNRATGGVAVLINNDGILTGDGVGHHIIIKKHPVTDVIFEGYKIPYWNEVQELVLKAHKLLPNIVSIGWDVAITPIGPVLLEGNDNWEIAGTQDSAGGMKKKWYELHNM